MRGGEDREIQLAKSFIIAFSGSPQGRIHHAQAEAHKAGALFQGDETAGSFQGNGVAGEYHIEGGTVTITITSKPFYAPWSLIESKLRDFFA